jgi:epoxide hydrolase-like predicted phosphatase
MSSDNRVIIFDFYGVIRADSLLRFLYDHNLTFTGKIRAADRAWTSGKTTRAQYLDYLAGVTGKSSEYIIQYMLDNGKISQTVLDVVARLRQNGYKTVLLSNSTADTRKYIELNQIESYFDDMILSYEVDVDKPDRRVYKFSLEKLGITAEQAIFIDDKDENTDAAENIGIKSILFTSADDLVVELRKLGVKI